MKLLSLILLACSIAILLPQVGSPQGPAPSHLYLGTSADSPNMHLIADSILREDPPNPGPSPYASVIHLNGHVEIRTCCVQLMPSNPAAGNNPSQPKVDAYMVMRADEAEYNAGTGEIEAHGTVQVSFQNVR